mmetsp:Transcript_62464/g.111624  ORF Transcript_62464/g.111624 Transcript_62464/m.111624 type:complete len:439 (+) Transcript_62464:1-1317(+)
MPALLPPTTNSLCLQEQMVHRECVSGNAWRALQPQDHLSLTARFCSELTNITDAAVFIFKEKQLEGSDAQEQSNETIKPVSTATDAWRQKALDGLRRSKSSSPGRTGKRAAVPVASTKASCRSRDSYFRRLGIPPRQPQAVAKRLPATRRKQASDCQELVLEETTRGSSKSYELVPQEQPMTRLSSTATSDSCENAASGPEVLDGSEVLAGQASRDCRARMKFLQKLSYERVWVPKARRPPSHQTVIIFDWDDTLLCTSFLNFVEVESLPSSVKRALAQIEKNATTLLKLAISLGQTFIVTNAARGWVEYSASQYVPGLLSMLQHVPVVSARSRYMEKNKYPGEVAKWKTEAFLELQQQLDSQMVTNLISLGDSHFEMDATLAMGERFEKAAVKTVKFQESPSAVELVKQQELVCKKFEKIVGAARDLKVQVVMGSKP